MCTGLVNPTKRPQGVDTKLVNSTEAVNPICHNSGVNNFRDSVMDSKFLPANGLSLPIPGNMDNICENDCQDANGSHKLEIDGSVTPAQTSSQIILDEIIDYTAGSHRAYTPVRIVPGLEVFPVAKFEPYYLGGLPVQLNPSSWLSELAYMKMTCGSRVICIEVFYSVLTLWTTRT